MLVHELNPQRADRHADQQLADLASGWTACCGEVFGETLRVIDPSEHAAPHFVEAVSDAYRTGRRMPPPVPRATAPASPAAAATFPPLSPRTRGTAAVAARKIGRHVPDFRDA